MNKKNPNIFFTPKTIQNNGKKAFIKAPSALRLFADKPRPLANAVIGTFFADMPYRAV